MRFVALLLLAVVSCKHAPERDEPGPREGELVVGLTDVFGQEAVLEAVAVEGYRFEYVAASSDTSHLVKASFADGGALTVEQTQELAGKLKGRPHVRFVEPNAVRQPR